MENKKIILLGGKGLSTNIVFNSLDKNFGLIAAIIENKESTKIFLKRRIKRLGLIKVLGQIAFQLLIFKPLSFFSKKRQNKIIIDNEIDVTDIPLEKIINVSSVNSTDCIELLKNLNPDLVIVNGTRIISKKVLNAVNSRFINTHAGITPYYRGVHGTYWALANNDLENSGVTVHFVDEGIDTGNIIEQIHVHPTPKDNFSTYPLLQLSMGLKILNKAVFSYLNNNLTTCKTSNTLGKLWYHPTIGEYLYNRIVKKVK